MKYIKVPEDIPIVVNGEPWKNSDGTVMKPWSFSHYLENIVLADPAVGTTYKDLKACFTIEDQFKNASIGAWVGVEDEHWEKLRTTIESPKGGGIPSSVLRQLIPFMDAVVIHAKMDKPDEVNEKKRGE